MRILYPDSVDFSSALAMMNLLWSRYVHVLLSYMYMYILHYIHIQCTISCIISIRIDMYNVNSKQDCLAIDSYHTVSRLKCVPCNFDSVTSTQSWPFLGKAIKGRHSLLLA